MKIAICMVLFCGSLHAATSTHRPEDIVTTVATPGSDGISRTVLEKLLAGFDQLDRKLLELQNGTSIVESKLITIENTIHRLEQGIGRNLSVILEQQTSSENQSSRLKQQHETTTTPKPEPPSSCKEIASNVSGVYRIYEKSDSSPIKVYCEMEKFDGGWIVVQHRFNGSVDFFRNWADYRDGFGELDGEFWLGLEHIHQLTTGRTHELVVEVKDFSDNYGYSRYNSFKVESEREGYRLESLGSYSGTAGNSMKGLRGKKFSTKDKDNDYDIDSHADFYEGGWWYPSGYSNLNGPYTNSTVIKGNWWAYFKNDYRGMSFTRMMIREL
ncbi:angiopoietin-related protein 1-like [Anopheles albimanus]|uniref:angiopoietin-related protein 1-like n=1 Tax=Anopheles albimanus TaxID=7167 RepID=UPI00163E0B19|nr:angiopoietin-related protein 1-like [Anopheles albimanus]